MATDETIGGVLAFLHELFPTREISDKAVDAWAIVFADWSDDELKACARLAAQEPGRAFFPTPGEITAHRPRPAIDAEAVLDRIAALGVHNPNVGWVYPRPGEIRDALGDAVAEAYVAAGGPRCFAPDAGDGSSVSRDIARREFAKQLDVAQRRSPTPLQLPAPAPKQLPPPPAPEVRQPLTDEQRDTLRRFRPPPTRRPTTVAGKVKLGQQYAADRAAAVRAWSDDRDHSADLDAIRERIADAYERAGHTPTQQARQRSIDAAVALRIGFPDLDAWCEQQGILTAPPSQTSHPVAP